MSFFAFYPPSGGGSSSNASVGTNGAAAPSSSTEIAGVDGGGILRPVSVDSSGKVNVNISSGITNPLPVQDSAAETSLSAINGKTPALGQALAAASVPVVLPATQITALTPPTTVTVVQPTASNLNVTSTVSNFPATQAVSGTVTANQGSAGASAWKVDGSAVTQPISATALPLPTGAATAANQSTANTSLASIASNTPALGQAVKASSVPVTIASDQGALSFINTPLILNTNSVTVVNGDVLPSTDVSQYAAVLFQLTGTWAGTVTFQGSNDNVTFSVINAQVASAANAAPVQTTTATNSYIIPVSARYIRIRVTTYTSGTVTGAGVALTNAPVDLGQRTVSITAGNTIGIAGGTQVIGSLAGTSTANSPVMNSYSSTPVTTSAYTQLIASTTSTANSFSVFDSSGQAMILATGASGSEVAQYYIPPGGATFGLRVTSGTRISIKALTATASTGYMLLNLLQ